MSNVFGEMGSSIAITSLTNGIAFGVAYFGINQMETSFIPERTFPGDSPLQDTIKIFNRIMKYNLPNTLHVQIWLNGYLEVSEEYGMKGAEELERHLKTDGVMEGR
uniref:Uncharacterized protein n=1 Tax=Meloidogyne javanica TaxID=6303 RepID=A0A915LP09_MELJA